MTAPATRAVPFDSAQRGKGPYIWRFSLFHRIIHAFAILTFYTLAITGIPLRFTCTPWSEPLIRFLGGVETAGLIHRVAGVITLLYGAVHFGYIAFKLIKGPNRKKMLWGDDSIVPHPKDAIDVVKQWGWFFGKAKRPVFGRYSYMEKLDYWGEIWGFVVIGGSGLLLWQPEWFSSWLPGWMYNVATIFHGYEALIAICFLFIVHFFNQLRPDKFPLDAVMFTGRATAEYMEEEHTLLAERLDLEGEVSHKAIHDRLAPAPGKVATVVAAIFGYLALAGGIAVIGMILWVLFC